MKRSAEILREHIDLVRGMDEGLLGTAAKVAGGALAGFGSGAGISSWFSKKDTTPKPAASKDPSKPALVGNTPAASSNPDDVDIGKMDASDPKDSGTQQSGLRNGGQEDGKQDRLGYTPEDYVDQSIVPVAASVGLSQGQSRFYRVIRAVDRAREQRGGRPPTVVLNSWDCAGSALILGTNNVAYSSAEELDKVKSAGGGWEQAFDPMGLDILSEGKLSVEPNQFGGAAVEYFVLMKKTGGNAYVFASLEQVVPFRSSKGPGLRSMFIDFFGPKKTWDSAGHDQFQALFSSFKLANGAAPLAPKDD